MNNLVKVENINGQILVSSRNIAEVFEKPHRDVLRKIRAVLTEREFSLSTYKDKSEKEVKVNKTAKIREVVAGPEFWLSDYKDKKEAIS